MSRSLLALLVALAAVVFPLSAFAQKPVTVHVIALDSDDASEDHADALTSALRMRVRNTPSFQLVESNQSLSTLLPALKCPSRPDSACLQRIGDQLKTDRFFWGSVVKAPMPHQVVAEIHLWTRGRPEQVAKETYSDNLKDQNDDALKRIAGGLFDRLTGTQTQGIVIVHANGSPVGTVIVDGKPAGQLDHGQATLQLPSGQHTVDVQVDKMTTTPQNINVVVNAQNEITFELQAVAAPPVIEAKPSHGKRTVGIIALVVGGAAAIGAGVMGALYASDASSFNTVREKIPTSFQQPCSDMSQFSGAAPYVGGAPALTSACNQRNSADTEGSIAWVLGGAAVGIAAIGVVLIVMDHPDSKEGAAAAPGARLRVLPSIGTHGAGLSALVSF